MKEQLYTIPLMDALRADEEKMIFAPRQTKPVSAGSITVRCLSMEIVWAAR